MRDIHGRFVPGTSGNPGGRPRLTSMLNNMIEAAAPELIRILTEIAIDPAQPVQARIAAAKTLLDRCYGRPAQAPAEMPSAEQRLAPAADARPAAPAAEPRPDPKPQSRTEPKPEVGNGASAPVRVRRELPATAAKPADTRAGAGPDPHLFSGTALSTSLLAAAAAASG